MTTYPYMTVGGVRLDDPQNRWGMDRSHPPRGLPGKRATSVTLPGRSGILRPAFDEPYESSMVTVNMIVMGWGSTPDAQIADLETNLDHLKWVFTQDVLDVVYYASASQAYRAAARYMTADISYYQEGNTSNAKVTFAIELTDPRWRAPLDQTYQMTNLLGAAEALPPFAGSTTGIDDAAYMIAGPFSQVTLRDNASQQYLTYRTAVPTGRTLLIYPSLFMARIKNTWNDWSYGGSDVLSDVSGDIINGGENSSTTWLTLNPVYTFGDATDRQVRLQAAVAGATSNTKVQIRGKAAYL